MNILPTDYVTHKNLDVVLADIIDFVGTCYDSHEEHMNKKLAELKEELKLDINKIGLDLQNYQQNTNRIVSEIRSEIEEIKNTNEELKDINNHILRMISYQENRLRETEKKAHTHSTDML